MATLTNKGLGSDDELASDEAPEAAAPIRSGRIKPKAKAKARPAPKVVAHRAPEPPTEHSEAQNRGATREKLRTPIHEQLSDADIMRMYEQEDSDQFYIDPDVVPDHLVYEWKRMEVYGKTDNAYEAEIARRGWVAVQADSAKGYFMPAAYNGAVTRGGQGLYAMEKHEYKLRARYQQLKAAEQVSDQEKILGIAPPGTGERKHARVRPTVTKNYEAAADVE
jgi:hypothetical protein